MKSQFSVFISACAAEGVHDFMGQMILMGGELETVRVKAQLPNSNPNKSINSNSDIF